MTRVPGLLSREGYRDLLSRSNATHGCRPGIRSRAAASAQSADESPCGGRSSLDRDPGCGAATRHCLVEFALGEHGQRLVQALEDPRDGRRGDAAAARFPPRSPSPRASTRPGYTSPPGRSPAPARSADGARTARSRSGRPGPGASATRACRRASPGRAGRSRRGRRADPPCALRAPRGQRPRHLLLQDILRELPEQKPKPLLVVFEQGFQF